MRWKIYKHRRFHLMNGELLQGQGAFNETVSKCRPDRIITGSRAESWPEIGRAPPSPRLSRTCGSIRQKPQSPISDGRYLEFHK
ncbi:uncharacterized protein PpBr36_06330 [Pyricularia pennisetigena]|uniref:uncharacterized protein n=1 Tax=Pyricularia pennisetigena TaxID=1578925 RepID=UPI001154C3AA|nr:uncharacterized protein PpBr36_06330 [Pyricularia pennisetigena]TLS23435.1 hypothetical protein PpBr36_06330 [Pyricularia pennisetigena]